MNNEGIYGGASPEVFYLHNADLEDSCQWVPPAPRSTPAPLPIYPAPIDLQVEVVRS